MEANGDCNVPKDRSFLGNWVGTQSTEYKAKRLSAERIARLEAIGFVWDRFEAAWEESFAELLAYKEANGDCNVPQGSSLGGWVAT